MDDGRSSGPARDAEARRARVRVEGIVQGVGFRPFVYRLARELRLVGFVRNDARGVLLEVEGEGEAVERFVARVAADAPPLARVDKVDAEPLPVTASDEAFIIVASEGTGEPAALVAPDTATCEDCLAELFDPGDRRYRYPFINCTSCGPRFTIVRGVPYDRPLTTMASFVMCPLCQAEYDDPANRRFHAQPNACPTCGPRARLLGRGGEALADGGDAVAAAAGALRDGSIVCVKGLGGYHLACLARGRDAVATLRARKHREDKPFAIMAQGLEAARRLAHLDAAEEALLTDRARPIVLARRRTDADVADGVAPGFRDLGVMLPYTPLHHLLLEGAGEPLVMTSGNVSDEPIAFRDDDALARLGGIADLFLTHDRPIETRTDDSIARCVRIGARRAPVVLRRSRGYVPTPIRIPVEAPPPLVACGAHQKNTFAVAKEGRVWVGHHIGDLENLETLRSFEEGIAHFERLFHVRPALAAHDLHPDYLSTGHALGRSERAAPVQHHHAHLAACLAEHGERGPAVGAIYDGTGYGTEGTVWGGEVLVGDLRGFERAAHLAPVRLPGGAAAIRAPWRMACSWLAAAFGEEAPALPTRLRGQVDASLWRTAARIARSERLSPITTSVGRLFDAVAALSGLRAVVTYEGQAAIDLEMAFDDGADGAYPLPLIEPAEPGGAPVLDGRTLVRAVMGDLEGGASAGAVSARFHRGLAEATARVCADVARRRGLDLVVLSGGVFQNVRLLEMTAAHLLGASMRVLVPERLPPNDGGISFGQAAIAAARAGDRTP